MANKADIKKAILAVAGNPESGPIATLADAMADAVVGLDAVKPSNGVQNASIEAPTKETRVTKVDEKR